MAKKQEDGRDEEIQALLNIEGIDTAKISKQITGEDGEVTPPVVTPPVTPPVVPPVVPPVTPPKENVPDTDTIKAGILNEMFGDQFKTVDDVKKANIPESLKELVTLRQKNQELDALVKAKPKHHFANDDIAMMNEFVRETGIKDVGVFNRLHVTDVANMDAMDALIMQHIIENPSLAGKESQVRRYLERRFDVDSSKIDPKQVESGDLTQEQLDKNKADYDVNLVGVTSEGAKAKVKLIELKGKIKMPEAPAEETPAGKTKWTPEIETQQKTAWTKVGEAMIGEFATLPIRAKGAKDPIVNFALPEDAKKSLLSDTMDYIVSNQMEVNQENVKAVGTQMYYKIKEDYFEDIIQAVSERVRSMSEEEYLKAYHNPSSKNNDTPDHSGEPESDEVKREKAFQAELGR